MRTYTNDSLKAYIIEAIEAAKAAAVDGMFPNMDSIERDAAIDYFNGNPTETEPTLSFAHFEDIDLENKLYRLRHPDAAAAAARRDAAIEAARLDEIKELEKVDPHWRMRGGWEYAYLLSLEAYKAHQAYRF